MWGCKLRDRILDCHITLFSFVPKAYEDSFKLEYPTLLAKDVKGRNVLSRVLIVSWWSRHWPSSLHYLLGSILAKSQPKCILWKTTRQKLLRKYWKVQVVSKSEMSDSSHWKGQCSTGEQKALQFDDALRNCSDRPGFNYKKKNLFSHPTGFARGCSKNTVLID